MLTSGSGGCAALHAASTLPLEFLVEGENPMRAARQISVVLFQESDQWVAQCLEYDIAAQAETLKDLTDKHTL